MDGETKTISEQEFKYLCGEVWAESIMKGDDAQTARSQTSVECVLLQEVINRLHQKLNIEDGDKREVRGASANAYSCRESISQIVRRHATQPFDHNKILNKLLHEVL